MSDKGKVYRNVGGAERILCVAVGAALIGFGLLRRSLGGKSMALGGAGILVWRGLTGKCLVYQALGINTAQADEKAEERVFSGKGITLEHSVVVDAPRDKVYAHFREVANLPRFMTSLKSVRALNPSLSHWEARSILGTTVSWDAELFNERPGEFIAWKSLHGSALPNMATVHFTSRGLTQSLTANPDASTEVRLVFAYEPPGGRLGAMFLQLFHLDFSDRLKADLERFKRFCETGGALGGASGGASGGVKEA